ncbi:adenylosuccinate synthase [Patescibacteria group bacterium]|nr:adenylosuccinate synthase [Patescibacteria group bacterium]
MFDKSISQVTAVIGAQWGDEGKGKLVDILSKEFDIILRATGGANAGHTIYAPNPINPEEIVKFVFHLAPSGIIHEGKIGVLGNGLAIHLPSLIEELDVLKKYNINPTGRLFLSDRAHIVFDYHKKIDAIEEALKGNKKVGTTLRGIGPAYQDKIARRGVRVGELLDFDKFADHVRNTFMQLQILHKDLKHDIEAELDEIRRMLGFIRPFIKDTAIYINDALKAGKTILIEGANGVLLDIDHGTYPFVTSSNPTAGGFHTGTGIGINKIQSLIGIVKAYMTRVGSGPFPTELFDETGDRLRDLGGEFGSTTGRPRRCGWFDAVATKYAVIINGLTSINLTKLDILDTFETIKVCTGYTHKGKKITSIPASTDILEECEPQYIEIEGWNCKTSDARTFDELPQKAKDYIKKLEELIECPINFVGVGVRRDQIIYKAD